jgi:hypothetical protein
MLRRIRGRWRLPLNLIEESHVWGSCVVAVKQMNMREQAGGGCFKSFLRRRSITVLLRDSKTDPVISRT